VSGEIEVGFERLSTRHDRSAFVCEQSSLTDYLLKFAGQNERSDIAACFVAIAPNTTRVLGYYTISAHAVLESAADLERLPEHLLPGILKTSRLGYDGKGQLRVATREELARAWDELKNVPCVLGQLLPLAAECSVIVARSHEGTMVHLPAQWNLHRGGILAVTEAGTGALPEATAARAVEATRAIADGLRYVGVLCVEFFLLQDGSLVVNEMAPRPHNSGHYSMDACDVSQFELQVRALAGLPLVQPRLHSPAIMLNLLGDLWLAGGAEAPPPWEQVLALPGVHLHLYGKLGARPGRKMGHLTVTGATSEEVRATALQAAAVLGIEPF